MSSDYQEGWRHGLLAGGSGNKIDGYTISSNVREYQVGYVMGFANSEHAGTPPPYFYRFAGEIARASGVPLSAFEQHAGLAAEDWDEFRAGYTGQEQEEEIGDDDDFDD